MRHGFIVILWTGGTKDCPQVITHHYLQLSNWQSWLKEEKVIRNVRGFTQLDANKSGVRFRNDQLTELNSEYQEARDQYTQQQEAIVSEVISVAGTYITADFN